MIKKLFLSEFIHKFFNNKIPFFSLIFLKLLEIIKYILFENKIFFCLKVI